MNVLEMGKNTEVNPVVWVMYALGIIDNWLEKMDKYFANPMQYSSIINKLGQCGINKELIDSMHVTKDFINKIVDSTNTNK